jgi:hypothetical protein
LLQRIEEPMKRFETNQNVLSTKDAKKIIKTYNKVARTLVAFNTYGTEHGLTPSIQVKQDCKQR